jgi:hypothetical protein
MKEAAWSPVLVDLVEWIEPQPGVADPIERSRLELRDEELTEVRALLSRAEDLIHDTLARHRPESSGPAVAAELELIAAQLSDRPETRDDVQESVGLLHRAAVLCAGGQWTRLRAVLPTLRLRLAAVAEAMAETAVGLSRLSRSTGPHLTLAPTAAALAFEADELAVAEALRQRTAHAGADSAHAAADAAFLPSLADFLR